MKSAIGYIFLGLSVFVLYFLGFTEDGQSLGYSVTYAVRSVMNL